MKGILLSCLAALCLSSCGGGAPPDAPGGGGVGGGGGPGVPVPTVPPPPVVPPPGPAPSMLPGPSFGIVNATGMTITAYGWWETRPGADGLNEPHWHWIAPLGGGVDDGATHLTPLTNGPVALPQPQVGPLDVVAWTSDGTTVIERVVFAPPGAAVWRAE